MRLLLLATALTTLSVPALAQSPWGGRARLALSAGLQPEGKGFSQTSELVAYVEPAPVTAALQEGVAPLFDIGVAFPVSGRFGANAAFSSLNASGAGTVAASIPHPFFFDALRPVSGVASLDRTEMALHGGLAYLAGNGPFDVLMSGGASWFRIRQTLVTDIEVDETYPFDTASFVSATVSEANASTFGYHAAADFTWRLSEAWGIGALVRYSSAEASLEAADVETVPATVGGFQAALGLRVIFP